MVRLIEVSPRTLNLLFGLTAWLPRWTWRNVRCEDRRVGMNVRPSLEILRAGRPILLVWPTA